MPYLFLIISSLIGLVDNFEIPRDAKLCAERYLESDWKPGASRNPTLYGMPENVVGSSSATLGQGYHFFELSPESTRSYVFSDVLDPRGFASRHVIHFPILVENKMVGVVKVIQIEGAKKEHFETCGTFTVLGRAVGGSLKEYYSFLSVPEEYGLSDATLSVVNFWTPAGETWHMFPTPSGAHIVFYRHDEHFLDRTAARFKQELKQQWEDNGN